MVGCLWPRLIWVRNHLASSPHQNTTPKNSYPWVSLGAPDACGFIPDFQYCHLDVALIYMR